MSNAGQPFNYHQTARVVFGAGVIRDAGLELKALGCQRALIVTDEFLRKKTDVVARLEAALGPRLAGVFDGVVADASVESIDAAAAMASASQADAVVSLGGGSAIDTGKGVAIVMRLGGSIRDHQGSQFLRGRAGRHVAIPTTAGTGSEVSMYCVVKDSAARQKLHFMDTGIIPDVAMLDPDLTMSLPPRLTAATGFDALTHGVEAYAALGRNAITDAQALHAIRLVHEFLPRAFATSANGAVGDATHDAAKDGPPGDREARGQMLLAANLAGAAMSNAGVGLAHAIAHVVGARHNVHHGVANAIALPHVIRFNAVELADRYRDVSDAMGISDAADGCAALAKVCELPTRYRDVGVPQSDLAAIADGAVSDGAIVFNGRFAADPALVLGVVREAW